MTNKTRSLIVLLTIIIALVAVSPAYAMSSTGEIKPVCTEAHGFFDRLFTRCVELETTTHTTTGDAVGDGMTKSNPVHDNTESFMCGINPEWSGCK
jgi:hypothetical protein